MTKGKLYRGRAKVEFLACKPEILAMREKGYSVRMIYDDLQGKGKVSVGYTQFCRYVTGKIPQKRRDAAELRTETPALPPVPPVDDTPSLGAGEASPPLLPAVRAADGQPGGAKMLDLKNGAVVSLSPDFKPIHFKQKVEE